MFSRRRVVVGGLSIGVGALVVACGSATPTSAPAATKPAAGAAPTSAPAGAAPTQATGATAPAAAAAPAKAATGAELIYLNQSRGQAKAMDALAAKYTQQSGVKVAIDSPGPTDYPKKLQA